MNKKLVPVIACMFLSSTSFASISINPVAHPKTCYAGRMCTLTGAHDIQIANDTDTDMIYQIHASLCADNGDCERYNRPAITVKAHDVFNDHHDYINNAKFNMAGTHSDTVYVMVQSGKVNKSNLNNATVVVYRN